VHGVVRGATGALKHAGRFVIGFGALATTLVGAWKLASHYADHGRSVKHVIVNGAPTIVVHDSTHDLWMAIYALCALAVLLLSVAIAAHTDRPRFARRPPGPATVIPQGPQQVHIYNFGANVTASTAAEIVRELQGPPAGPADTNTGGTDV